MSVRIAAALAAALPLPGDLLLEAVLLTGSHAKGEAEDDSDIDLVAIVREPVVWRSYFRHEATDVDLFAYGAAKLTRTLRDRVQPIVQMIATSIVIVDASGAGERVRAVAREAMAAGPIPANPLAVDRYRHRIVTALDHCARAARRDLGIATTLLDAEIPELVTLYFTLQRVWRVDLRRAPDLIAAMDAELAAWLASAMNTTMPFAVRLESLRCAVERVLAPAGGSLRYFSASIADGRGAGVPAG